MHNEGIIKPSRIGVITVEDIANNLIFTNQCVFSISKRFQIPGSSEVDIIVDPTGLGDGKSLVLLPISLRAFQAGPIEIDLYINTDSDDDGVLWDSINRNNTSEKTAGTVVRFNPTINGIGLKLPTEFEIFSNGVPAVTTLGGEVKDDLVFKTKTDVKYMIRMRNLEASVARGVASLNWFEI